MINNPPSLKHDLSTVSIIQECDKMPVYSQQQLKFYDPSFFSHVNTFKGFLLPSSTELDIANILKYKKKRSCIKNCIYMDNSKL